jgi:prolyl 4-hydroxylase
MGLPDPIAILALMPTEMRGEGLLVADGLLSGQDLARLEPVGAHFHIQRTSAGVARDGLPERREHASRDDEGLAALLWARLAPVLPPLPEWYGDDALTHLDPPLARWSAVGCNPRIRYYRYQLGDRFAPHYDEPFRARLGLRTFLTVLVYLPTGVACAGGETVINGEVIGVLTGRIAVFDHRLIHEGRPVEGGSKLVLRTDIVAEATS